MQVNEFVYIPGENEVEYIALLKEALRRQRTITNKAIAKLKENKIPLTHWMPIPDMEEESDDAE